MTPASSRDPLHILKSVFGHRSFRDPQREIIDHVLAGRDALVVLATGSGKSLCYQLPALIFDGMTVVVSPLISLMQDQVAQLKERGVCAEFLNSSLDQFKRSEILSRVRNGQVKLLYMAPESLKLDYYIGMLDKVNVSCLAVDEAHCISQWGHDFRPDYRKLIEVRKKLNYPVCVALTATATPRVQEDIIEQLSIPKNNKFISSFDRENLYLSVEPMRNLNDQIFEFLIDREEDESGIIYCQKRVETESIHAMLDQYGFSSRFYHAGMDPEERAECQEAFMSGEVNTIVATIAFGMGIDKNNIRYVLHAGMPGSPEAYYQEIGRAGRDNDRAECLWLFRYGDADTVQFFIDQGDPSEKEGRQERLNWLIGWATANKCRRKILLDYFGETYPQERCGMCDKCQNGASKPIKPPAPEPTPIVEPPEYDQKLYELLREERIRIAAENGISVTRALPYKALKQMAAQKPLTDAEFLKIDGIGKVRLEKYGETFMSIIRSHLNSPVSNSSERSPSEPARETGLGSRHIASSSEYDRDLYALLREERKRIGEANDISGARVFSYKTLKEMTARKPQTIDELSTIDGVTHAKLMKYGQVFLSIIRRHGRQ